MFAHLTKKSSNSKTGDIPVSTTSFKSCPENCELKKNGCYADSGPLAIHWKAVTEEKRGKPWQAFCDEVKKLPIGVLFRHNQAGDLPGNGFSIDAAMLSELILSAMHVRGFTYTHYSPAIGENARIIAAANKAGFTINLSAESLEHADALHALNIGPVVTIIPEGLPNTMQTPAGNKVITCPATYRDDISCKTCELCQKQNRPIVAFPVHGTSKKKAAKVFSLKKV